MAYRKKKSHTNQKSDTAFSNLWTANQKKQEYDSLYDQHTQYYFASPPVQKHLHQLSQVIYTSIQKIKRNPFSTLHRRKKSELMSLTKGISEKSRII